MTPLPGLYVFGFGGHARSVGDVALACGIANLVFIDAAARPNESFAGQPVLTTLPDPPQGGWGGFVALGDNARRRTLCDGMVLPMPALVAPTASVGLDAVVAEAVFVGHQAHIGPLVTLERGAIINSGAVVDHESRVGAFSHVAVNATVAGRCSIGAEVFIGAGATVIDGITIVDGVTIGAGATVTRDIAEPGVYVGTPARRLQR